MARKTQRGSEAWIPKMLEYGRAAELLGIPLGTLYEWVCRKKVPHVRLGPRLVRFDADDLKAWLESRKIPVGGSQK